MPRRSREPAQAGLILFTNELRLGKPCPVAAPQHGAHPRTECENLQKQPTRLLRPLAENCHAPPLAPDFTPHLNVPCLGIWIANVVSMARDKRFVSVLRTSDQEPKFYVGLSSDV
jgi:hypothetical protein